MAKKCVHITVDEDVWENARKTLPNISKEVNDFLKDACNLTDDEDELVKTMEFHKTHYRLAKRNLCKYREDKATQIKESTNLESVLSWARGVYSRKGILGLNILEKECKSNNVDFDVVKNLLEREDVAFVNFDG